MPHQGVASRHAELRLDGEVWSLHAAEGCELRQGNASRSRLILEPGLEIGIGAGTLVAEGIWSIALRELCERILGRTDDKIDVVDRSMRVLRDAVTRGTAIVLRGESDLVPVAHAIHRRMFGTASPFVVCDPRRTDGDGSARSPANRATIEAALELASGGSICVRGRRLPEDIDLLRERPQRSAACVRLFICVNEIKELTCLCVDTLDVPSLEERISELDDLIDEHIKEAARGLVVEPPVPSLGDRAFILYNTKTWADLQKAVTRWVILKVEPNVCRAAGRLKIAPVSLSRWSGRRSS
jgi:hypothetical protein